MENGKWKMGNQMKDQTHFMAFFIIFIVVRGASIIAIMAPIPGVMSLVLGDHVCVCESVCVSVECVCDTQQVCHQLI